MAEYGVQGALSCYDFVTQLPEVLAASCLSFLDVNSLLGAAQLVNHAWHHAINGGLPAVWHCVHVRGDALTDSCLQDVANNIMSLQMSHCSISPILPHLPFLEDLNVYQSDGVIFPPLRFLRKVRCAKCHAVSGLHNLPSLTSLELSSCTVDKDDVWPGGIRKVVIHFYRQLEPVIFDRIFSLPQLRHLDTDWTFASEIFNSNNTLFTPPYDQLSFLPRITTLQHLTLTRLSPLSILPLQPFFDHICSLTSLRQLKLDHINAIDQDLHSLCQLPNLRAVTLCFTPQITNQGLQNVCAIPNLTKLCISHCPCITDFSCVGQCSMLKVLILRRNLSLSLVEVQAITRLQHLRKLVASVILRDPLIFSHFCSMVSLRELASDDHDKLPASAYANLPSLTRLESIRVSPVDHHDMVDCLVRMPSLRRICLRYKLNKQEEARLRDSLPRLETLSYTVICRVDIGI